MKKFLLFLLVVALFPAAYSFAQEDGRRHGGGNKGNGSNRDEGGVGNANSSGGEKIKNSGDGGDKSQWKDTQKVKKQRKAGNAQSQPQKQRMPNNAINRNSNGNANLEGNHQVQNPNQNFNSQDQISNRPGNQGMGRNKKRNGGGNDNSFGKSPSVQGENNDKFRKGQNGNGQPGGHVDHAQNAAVPPRFQKMGIRSVPERIQNGGQILRTNRQQSVITPPGSGPHGRELHASAMAPRAMTSNIVQTHMSRITNNASFTAQINVYNRNENRANNYYWHTWNGNNYCHYYDNWGYHWYGWYIGPHYFWTRYYSDNWWWYDGAYDRWCYWHDGGWWWQDPHRVNVVYVYNNGDYAPVNYDQSNNNGSNNGSNMVVYQSNDGTRKVKIMGDSRDAFLYDTNNSPSFDPVFLGTGVREVKFSDTSNGSPLQIMLTLNNGSFQMLDGNGNRYNTGNND